MDRFASGAILNYITGNLVNLYLRLISVTLYMKLIVSQVVRNLYFIVFFAHHTISSLIAHQLTLLEVAKTDFAKNKKTQNTRFNLWYLINITSLAMNALQ